MYMSNESLIYVLVSWVFHNVHLRHFGDLKMGFLLILQRVFLSQRFWIYLCFRNNCKYHIHLNVTSDCLIRNTRITHLMSCIWMSNFVSLNYVLVSRVFRNVHFRNFGNMKMRLLFIRQRVLLSQWFWI